MSQNRPIIDLATPADALDRGQVIREAMIAEGFCVIRGLPNDGDALLALAQRFGDVQRHIRADDRGVVGDTPADLSWRSYITEYNGVNTEEFDPHTDGSFVDGLLVEAGQAKRIVPPRLLLLQIAQRAEQGGDNMIVDGGKILAYLAEAEPDLIGVLCRPGCLAISRDDQMALEAAVFQPWRRGALKMRFRYDDKVYTPSWARSAVTRFHQLTLDPRFCQDVNGEQGDILVIDNGRMLHGRKKFIDQSASRRKFRRIWIRDDDAGELFNVDDRPHVNRSQDIYRPYASIPSPLPKEEMIGFPCGIALPPHLSIDWQVLVDFKDPISS